MKSRFEGALLLLLVVLLVLVVAQISAERNTANGNEPVAERYVTVKPGDTLWAIAAREYPGQHTGKRVHEIRQLNPGIDPGRLQVGQRVRIP